MFDQKQLHQLCTAQDMQKLDSHTIHQLGMPSLLLMENAGRAVADWVDAHHLQQNPDDLVVVCCGNGNNGGDGYVIARLLKNRGYSVKVVCLQFPKSDDAQANAKLWQIFGGETLELLEKNINSPATRALSEAKVIVDAIFGVSFRGELQGAFYEWIQQINHNQHALKIAVDLPSGINPNSGDVQKTAVQCHATIALQKIKQGCLQFPARRFVGSLHCMDICVAEHLSVDNNTFLMTPEFAKSLLPVRPIDGHKGTFGHLFLACGSAGMSGAASLASQGGLRSGAGLVTAFVPRQMESLQCLEAMTTCSSVGADSYFSKEQIPYAKSLLPKYQALVIGCGVGKQPETAEFVNELVKVATQPTVIDADGLNLLNTSFLEGEHQPLVLTPHPKELSRLCGESVETISKDRLAITRHYAQKWKACLILKGAYPVVGMPDGSLLIVPVANDALATAGSGDVLAGIIGGYLAQRLTTQDAASLGCFIHGLTGELISKQLASSFVNASDLVKGLNLALKFLQDLTPRRSNQMQSDVTKLIF